MQTPPVSSWVSFGSSFCSSFPHPDRDKQKCFSGSQGWAIRKQKVVLLLNIYLLFLFTSFHVFFPLISRFLPASPLRPLSHCPLNHLLAPLFPAGYLPSPRLGPAFVYTIPSIWIYGTHILSHIQMFPNIWVVWHPTATAAG